MEKHLSIGTILYHKYLSNITVVKVFKDGLKARTGAKEVYEFRFYDFGKVLFFDKTHERGTFESYKDYLNFYEEENKNKILENEKNKRELLKREKEEQDKSIEEAEKLNRFFELRVEKEKEEEEDKNKIKEIVERRKIEYLVHFTRIENLQNILQHGLIPVSMQSKMEIDSFHNDKRRIDSRRDCTSCSISFPNYKLFYKFRESNYPGSSWVVLVLNKDVLFSSSNEAYYCSTNAARVLSRISKDKELCTSDAFENMFCEIYNTKDNRTILRSALRIDENYTTDPQAEILIRDIISKNYIQCICFQNQQDVDNFVSMHGGSLLSQYGFLILPGIFGRRPDYLFWQKEY